MTEEFNPIFPPAVPSGPPVGYDIQALDANGTAMGAAQHFDTEVEAVAAATAVVRSGAAASVRITGEVCSTIALTPGTQPESPATAYVVAAQKMLDDTAKTRNYDGILSMVSYVSSTSPVFKAEALAGLAWRDAVWTEAYRIMAEVQAGRMALPTVPGFLAMLPTIQWPE